MESSENIIETIDTSNLVESPPMDKQQRKKAKAKQKRVKKLINSMLKDWKELAEELGVNANIIVYDPKTKELTEAFTD